MHLLTRALSSLTRARGGAATIEHGLIAALIGVVIVSVVTSLGATMDATADAPGQTTAPR